MKKYILKYKYLSFFTLLFSIILFFINVTPVHGRNSKFNKRIDKKKMRSIISGFRSEIDLIKDIQSRVRNIEKNRCFNPKEIKIDKKGIPKLKDIPKELEANPDEVVAECNDNKAEIAIQACKCILKNAKTYRNVTLNTIVSQGFMKKIPTCPWKSDPGRYKMRIETYDTRTKLYRNRKPSKRLRDIVTVKVWCSLHKHKVSKTVNPKLVMRYCRRNRRKVKAAFMKYARKNQGSKTTIDKLISLGYLKSRFSRCPLGSNYIISFKYNKKGKVIKTFCVCPNCGR